VEDLVKFAETVEGSDRTVFTMHSMFGKNIISKYPDESDADFIKRIKQLNKVEV
jgi:hypothetical protein